MAKDQSGKGGDRAQSAAPGKTSGPAAADPAAAANKAARSLAQALGSAAQAVQSITPSVGGPPPLPGSAGNPALKAALQPEPPKSAAKDSKDAPLPAAAKVPPEPPKAQAPKPADTPARQAPNSGVAKPEPSAGPRTPVAGALPAPKTEAKAPKSAAATPTPAPADEQDDNPSRRVARRRPAGPGRDRIAANDDAPSIGGLIYALNQRPSKKPLLYAGIASGLWAAVTIGFAIAFLGPDFMKAETFAAGFGRFETLSLLATLGCPIALFWFFGFMAMRTEELRLRSTAMTEVAVRLAEPDRMAEQSVASLGQAVRRQVSFMNDAVARALGRAGELEALVHNEVTALERSYEENERKIRSLIDELANERGALVNTSDRVSDTLKSLGTEIPGLIENLSSQQIKLARIIEGAGQNLTALETAIGTKTEKLETTLGAKTEHLQIVLEDYTTALGGALGARTEHMQALFSEQLEALDSTIAGRTEGLQTVFEEYGRALDAALANRSQALDMTLIERTRALDDAFSERLKLFDESILRSTITIDGTIGERALALTSALDTHARTLSDTLGKQAGELDETLMNGINAVRRTSENITRQSIKAIEGLAGQSEMLKSVSENLLSQINSVTNRFENQGSSIMRAANALESANLKIDKTLQSRHAELTHTIDKLTGRADEFGNVLQGYSSQLEGTVSEAERRARMITSEIAKGAEQRSLLTLAELERLKSAATDSTDRALDELRSKFGNVSREVSQNFSALSTQFDASSSEFRQRAKSAVSELEAEQERLRRQLDALPGTAREGAEALRRSLQDQLRALEQLSTMTSREAQSRDVSRPLPPARPLVAEPDPKRSLSSLTNALTDELLRTRGAGAGDPGTPLVMQPSAAPMPPRAPSQPDPRDGWSLGDLLARASQDEEQGGQRGPGSADPAYGAAPRQPMPYAAPPQQTATGLGPGGLDIQRMARALDPASASMLWGRLGAGQRGIMVRSIYTPDGRALFDEVVDRYRTDPGFRQSVQGYLGDFERLLQDSENQDSSGRTAQGHLVSELGRVYLFLGHASGRIS